MTQQMFNDGCAADNAAASDDDIESSMGFMFDACHARVMREFEIGGELRVRLRMIKGDPGHVQSGQYLWPAAHFAAKWLYAHSHDWLPQSSTIVELGAGCGLAGLATWHMPNVCAVVLTDYDYGSLQLLQENAAEARASRVSEEATGGDLGVLRVERLEWGVAIAPSFYSLAAIQGAVEGASLVDTDGGAASTRHLRVIGTDLIYAKDVVAPLLGTVAQLFAAFLASTPGVSLGGSEGEGEAHHPAACFVLFSSFDICPYDQEIARVCAQLGLEHRDKAPLDTAGQASRVSVFTSKT